MKTIITGILGFLTGYAYGTLDSTFFIKIMLFIVFLLISLKIMVMLLNYLYSISPHWDVVIIPVAAYGIGIEPFIIIICLLTYFCIMSIYGCSIILNKVQRLFYNWKYT